MAVLGLTVAQSGVIQELITIIIKIANAIPAMALLIAPMSFNVPAAINLILLIIDAINLLCTKMKNIVNYLEPLKKLRLLIDEKAFDAITAPVNIAIVILIALATPISVICKFVDILSKKANDEIGKAEDEDGNPVSFPKLPLKYDESQLKKVMQDMDALSDLEKIPGLGSYSPLRVPRSSRISYVYDVEYPDGSVSVGLDKESIDDLKDIYNVVFNNGNSTE